MPAEEQLSGPSVYYWVDRSNPNAGKAAARELHQIRVEQFRCEQLEAVAQRAGNAVAEAVRARADRSRIVEALDAALAAPPPAAFGSGFVRRSAL